MTGQQAGSAPETGQGGFGVWAEGTGRVASSTPQWVSPKSEDEHRRMRAGLYLLGAGSDPRQNQIQGNS